MQNTVTVLPLTSRKADRNADFLRKPDDLRDKIAFKPGGP